MLAVNESAAPSAEGVENLDLITTHWSTLRDSNRFLIRYAQAVRSYVLALVGNAEDADDVAHDFFVRVVERGFERADPDRGRFRDYLKIAVRNAALSHLRRKQRQPRTLEALECRVPDPECAADREWLRQWQACVLERAWRALERHQRGSPDNLCHTVLRVHVDHPEDDSQALADRAAAASGRPLSPDAYRKQLSRARRRFAQLVVDEVVQTLHCPTSDEILEELAEIGLLDHVVPYLTKS
jgi:RNA polymerase sigma-70 factor (ECF subfamily)